MKNWLKKIWTSVKESHERRVRAEALRHLDARTLRDIGMESWIDVNRMWGAK
ncbi:MAG TPA: hypothetical protein VEB41_00120 [Burkholderiales bacterium]|nr:hypothetical protein [Burkholderiales bacterium]